MSSEVKRVLPDTAVVTPPTVSKNSRGGEAKIYDPLNTITYTSVMLSPASAGQYKLFAETIMPGSLFTLRFPQAVSIVPEAKIVINGSEYQLMSPSPEASYDLSETFMVTLKT